MSSPQSSTPYSLRLPTKLAQLIDQVAKKLGKPAPDAVRAGIEAAFSNEYRMLALDAANGNRAETLRTLRGVVAEASNNALLPMPIYSAIMYFAHWAYSNAGSAGYVNHRYLTVLMDITGDLMSLAEGQTTVDIPHLLRSCLQIEKGESIYEGIHRLKLEIEKGVESGYAEFLTRPLESMADELQYLDPKKVAKIFAPHLKTLLPVAVLGAKSGIDKDIVLRDMDDLLPEPESFNTNGLGWILQSKGIYLVVSGSHHTNVFGTSVVLSLYTAIECNALESLLAPNVSIRSFSRGTFEMTRSNENVLFHTKGGYRLVLSVPEARELIDQLTAAFSKPAWRGLVTRFRELSGDI
ncbi:hypothetical protein KZ843_06600 [Pseudomonas aeruginosa]|nr:hypothetical protein [Pseudomonas aeruginosa]MBW6122561.1 hypothetical protein [Pseudomonas aeruginosa]